MDEEGKKEKNASKMHTSNAEAIIPKKNLKNGKNCPKSASCYLPTVANSPLCSRAVVTGCNNGARSLVTGIECCPLQISYAVIK